MKKRGLIMVFVKKSGCYGIALLAVVSIIECVLAAESESHAMKGALSPKSIVAANLIRDGSWYALDSEELGAIRKLLKGKAFHRPTEVREVLFPPFRNTIILWGVDGSSLAQIEVVEFDDAVAFINSLMRTYIIETEHSRERKVISDLVDRIRGGKVGSVAHERASGEKQITNSIGMKLMLIPSGEFMMGSDESAEETAAFFDKTYGEGLLKADYFKDEHPQHRVRITQPFYLGTYHVTRGQFRQFVKDSGYKTDAEKGENPGAFGWDSDKKKFGFNAKYSWRNAGFKQTDEHPVVNVSWNDAVAFCKWLSKKEGQSYRLPTEAEWEYACRAGTTTRYYSGDDPETLAKVGNVADAAAKAKFPDWKYTTKANDGYVFTAPVGKFRPNPFGLFDMHGNAWQWCADWYGADYYAASPAVDPTGPNSGDDRVLCGGSWNGWLIDSRSARRNWLAPDYRDSGVGLRVARTQ